METEDPNYRVGLVGRDNTRYCRRPKRQVTGDLPPQCKVARTVCGRMLKKSASFVLASFRLSTYASRRKGAYPLAYDSERAVQAKYGMYLLGPSLAMALCGERRVLARWGGRVRTKPL